MKLFYGFSIDVQDNFTIVFVLSKRKKKTEIGSNIYICHATLIPKQLQSEISSNSRMRLRAFCTNFILIGHYAGCAIGNQITVGSRDPIENHL